MELYYTLIMFVFGTIFGSFYNVVGDRLPNGESIVKPRSHCPKCGHVLGVLELIPVLSFLFQSGKCKNCKSKIPIIHPLFELFSGTMFSLCYTVFGFGIDFLIALTLISMLLIIIVSDIKYFIISDEVLIVGGIVLAVLVLIGKGPFALFTCTINGVIAFLVMLFIKIMGDHLFKKESMGGGDIKLMFFFGFVLGWEMALLTIFLGSVIGLPISLIILFKNKTNIIPFGPFLSLGAMIILLTQFDFIKLLSLIS
ncbi:MAG: prepilin peptidase [Bacilli bacterium]